MNDARSSGSPPTEVTERPKREGFDEAIKLVRETDWEVIETEQIYTWMGDEEIDSFSVLWEFPCALKLATGETYVNLTFWLDHFAHYRMMWENPLLREFWVRTISHSAIEAGEHQEWMPSMATVFVNVDTFDLTRVWCYECWDVRRPDSTGWLDLTAMPPFPDPVVEPIPVPEPVITLAAARDRVQEIARTAEPGFTPAMVTVEEVYAFASDATTSDLPRCWAKEPDPTDEDCRGCSLLVPCFAMQGSEAPRPKKPRDVFKDAWYRLPHFMRPGGCCRREHEGYTGHYSWDETKSELVWPKSEGNGQQHHVPGLAYAPVPPPTPAPTPRAE